MVRWGGRLSRDCIPAAIEWTKPPHTGLLFVRHGEGRVLLIGWNVSPCLQGEEEERWSAVCRGQFQTYHWDMWADRNFEIHHTEEMRRPIGAIIPPIQTGPIVRARAEVRVVSVHQQRHRDCNRFTSCLKERCISGSFGDTLDYLINVCKEILNQATIKWSCLSPITDSPKVSDSLKKNMNSKIINVLLYFKLGAGGSKTCVKWGQYLWNYRLKLTMFPWPIIHTEIWTYCSQYTS